MASKKENLNDENYKIDNLNKDVLSKKDAENDLKFEEAIKQLEEIASELEKGDLDLDSSVSKFEEGMKISKKCNSLLEDAEKRITILLNDNGNLKEEDFKPEED